MAGKLQALRLLGVCIAHMDAGRSPFSVYRPRGFGASSVVFIAHVAAVFHASASGELEYIKSLKSVLRPLGGGGDSLAFNAREAWGQFPARLEPAWLRV